MTSTNTSNGNADLDLKAIVEHVQNGDIHAYTEIIRSFQKPIYTYCYYLLGSKEEAEDASQDIFIKGLENINGFTYTVSFSAWLYKIAHHHCIDLLKKKNKSYKFWTSFKKEQSYDQPQSEANLYDDIIHELLEKLNMDERRILLLRSIEEYSFDEIASIITTQIVLTDNSKFTLSPLAMAVGVNIFDDHGNELQLLTGNGWNATDGNNQIMDLRYHPFESVAKTITIKPYVQLYEDYQMGIFQMDENGVPKIQYIPELEVILPINSQK